MCDCWSTTVSSVLICDGWCGLNVTVSSLDVGGEFAGLMNGCENVGGLTAIGLGVSNPLSADAEGRMRDADAP